MHFERERKGWGEIIYIYIYIYKGKTMVQYLGVVP